MLIQVSIIIHAKAALSSLSQVMEVLLWIDLAFSSSIQKPGPLNIQWLRSVVESKGLKHSNGTTYQKYIPWVRPFSHNPTSAWQRQDSCLAIIRPRLVDPVTSLQFLLLLPISSYHQRESAAAQTLAAIPCRISRPFAKTFSFILITVLCWRPQHLIGIVVARTPINWPKTAPLLQSVDGCYDLSLFKRMFINKEHFTLFKQQSNSKDVIIKCLILKYHDSWLISFFWNHLWLSLNFKDYQ